MKVTLRMWNGVDEPLVQKVIESKEIIVKDGATLKFNKSDITTLVVVNSDGIYHPVYDLWVD